MGDPLIVRRITSDGEQTEGEAWRTHGEMVRAPLGPLGSIRASGSVAHFQRNPLVLIVDESGVER